MGRLDEILSGQFAKWEQRGRGWMVWPQPVVPEPPFQPFRGYTLLRPDPALDDGRRPGIIASLFDSIERGLNPKPPVIEEADEPEPEPEVLEREPLIELQTSLPAKLNISAEAFAPFLLNVSLCREPVVFELIGEPGRVSLQFAAQRDDASLVRRQLQAHFSEATFQQRTGTLERVWENSTGDEALVVEFGLAREFMYPLSTGKLDPFVGIIGALSDLQVAEVGLFQVIFQPVENEWAESTLRSVTHLDGKPFFVNSPELAAAAEKKVGSPLFAAVVRLAVRSASYDRTVQIARDLAGSLRVFANPQGNELIPLENSEYSYEDHIEDTLRRQSRRSGMILNIEELTGFVHLPSSAVRSAVLQRETGRSKPAPMSVRAGQGILLGNNIADGEIVQVRLTPEQRVRHCHIIGASGTGKSTLLFNLIRQDIENGQGLAVLDPHGDLTEQVLGIIPPNRIDDVVLVDPSDEDYSVGFNILSAHSDLEKNLLASDLVSVFQRLSASWGDQMGSVLQNAILAFLESSQGGTLADLRRFLIEPAFRNDFLKTVKDPDIVYYWRKAFTQLSGNKSVGPALTRLEMFLSRKPIRYMVSQQVNRLDFGNILDTGKIFLAKLPQGQMGNENAFLLGSFLVAKFQQLAMGRQAKALSHRRDFWLYLDEAPSFSTASMAEILTGARKYRLGLVFAHQELRQLERDRELSSAVMSNSFTRIVFRVGDSDARYLENGFSSFEARDLQNLETGQAICRVEKASGDFNLSVPFPDPIDPAIADETRRAVVAASRAKYATPRAEVEAALAAKLNLNIFDAPEEVRHALEKKRVSKVTVSEEKQSTPDVPKPVEVPVSPVREPVPPRDLGRGGAQHKTIQERLQVESQALGFLAVIEGPAGEQSRRAADLALRRGDLTIAVEISVTTTTDHEFRNVRKCLDAGFSRVAVVSPQQERLQAIKAAVEASLGSIERVTFHTPDEFIVELRKLAESSAKPLPAVPNERTSRGYKVRKHGIKLSPEEQKAKEAAAVKMLSQAMNHKQ